MRRKLYIFMQATLHFEQGANFFCTSEGDSLLLYPCEKSDMYLISVTVVSNYTEEQI